MRFYGFCRRQTLHRVSNSGFPMLLLRRKKAGDRVAVSRRIGSCGLDAVLYAYFCFCQYFLNFSGFGAVNCLFAELFSNLRSPLR